MNCYRAYGIEICSDFSLPEFPEGGEGKHVHLELGSIESVPELHRTSIWRHGVEARYGGTENESYLDWPGIVTFRAKAGKVGRFQLKSDDIDSNKLSSFAASEALGMLLFQRGLFLLHASAVRMGDEAVLFVGPPGSGKSTLAAACAQMGLPVLGDDLAALSFAGTDGVFLQPGPSQIKVWPSTVAGLGWEPSRFAQLVLDSPKLSLRTESARDQEAVPVRNIFFLKRSKRTEVTRLSLRDAQVSLLRFFPCPSAMFSPERLRRHFLQSSDLLTKARCWMLRNSIDFERLKKLVARLDFEVRRESPGDKQDDRRRLDERVNSKFSSVDLVAPHRLDTFMKDCFEKTPLHVPRRDASHFSRIIDFPTLDTLFHEYGIPGRLLRIFKDGIALKTPQLLDGGVVETDELFKLFFSGATIIINEADKLLPDLGQFCDAVERELRIAVNANIYLTPPNARGFSAHYDTHDVFIMQIYGVKRWKVYDSPVALPSSRQAHVKGRYPVQHAEQELDLRVGDTLYIPRGFIHEGVTSSEGSVHVTLGLHPSYWYDLVQEVGRMAQDDVRFRRSLPCAITSEADKQEFRAEFGKALIALIEGVPLDRVMEKKSEAFIMSRRKHNQGRLSDLMQIAEVNRNSIVAKRDHVLFQRQDKGKMIRVSFEGKTVEVPCFLGPSLAIILNRQAFRVSEIGGIIDDAGRVDLVRRFVREGFLQILSSNGD